MTAVAGPEADLQVGGLGLLDGALVAGVRRRFLAEALGQLADLAAHTLDLAL